MLIRKITIVVALFILKTRVINIFPNQTIFTTFCFIDKVVSVLGKNKLITIVPSHVPSHVVTRKIEETLVLKSKTSDQIKNMIFQNNLVKNQEIFSIIFGHLLTKLRFRIFNFHSKCDQGLNTSIYI
ncbi:hypothetical protein BpHYR1_038517 [Brachionus plicatilis]|uniref:Uncharacterized protein n=1 Tax=Brachionus plicatilis TaxID=10195 RepID=A0A3M7Q0E1_BRAPC|nr:hypothetical protein BpHYR1_038517 [Brachionus plicatilis]